MAGGTAASSPRTRDRRPIASGRSHVRPRLRATPLKIDQAAANDLDLDIEHLLLPPVDVHLKLRADASGWDDLVAGVKEANLEGSSWAVFYVVAMPHRRPPTPP
ncbi:MAG: hypothetical protein ACKVT1_01145 [Dehalococcoidia bacterium]